MIKLTIDLYLLEERDRRAIYGWSYYCIANHVTGAGEGSGILSENNSGAGRSV